MLLRSYKAVEWFPYSHDNDLNGWIVRDILENKHLRLIGQETSANGVFVGPLFYYLLIPFYLIFKMDPKGSLILPIIISGFSIFSFYYVFSKVFNKRIGIFASLIYSISTLVVFTDREIVPTQPAVLWAVWFFYGLWLLLKGKRKAFISLAFLIGIAWNFNLALIILTPLTLVALLLSKKLPDIKHLALGFLAFILALSPFLAFEIRHNFSQSRAIYLSLTTEKDYIYATARGYEKFDRVMQLVYRNTTRLVWGEDYNIPGRLTFLVLIFSFAFLYAKKIIHKNLFIIMTIWLGTYLAFFTFNSINLSEYYLNGMNVVWIGILALSMERIFSRSYLLGFLLAAAIFVSNFSAFANRPAVTNGYIERKNLAEFIKKDAENHDYPCVSVSFITSPGNDLGYRYPFWLTGLHVNHPDSGSPVYTIVFPHTMVGRLDNSFGSLGLVLPGYERYTKSAVEESCKGENSNLTDPMLKFTK
ncbi:glycosyltransferase family 39 protein [Candidatus Woesebacteria bacterium]|nr:glycosyltransferase family 39 protein [Candidatus Woesebacteria bacterium]